MKENFFLLYSRNLPFATAGENVGRRRHQILQILPLLVDLCEGRAATWEGLIKIWNLQTGCQGIELEGRRWSTNINQSRTKLPPALSTTLRLFFIDPRAFSEIFREVHWREARESKSPQKYQLVQRERKAEKGSIDFVLNRPPRLPFLAALTLMGWTKGDQEAQNQHDALCSALPPAWAAGSICIMERLGVIQFQGRPTAVRLSGPLHEGGYFTAHGPPLATLHSKRASYVLQRCTLHTTVQ